MWKWWGLDGQEKKALLCDTELQRVFIRMDMVFIKKGCNSDAEIHVR